MVWQMQSPFCHVSSENMQSIFLRGAQRDAAVHTPGNGIRGEVDDVGGQGEWTGFLVRLRDAGALAVKLTMGKER